MDQDFSLDKALSGSGSAVSTSASKDMSISDDIIPDNHPVNTGKPGVLEDISKSVAQGAYEIPADIVGAPVDILNAGMRGGSWLAKHAIQGFGPSIDEKAHPDIAAFNRELQGQQAPQIPLGSEAIKRQSLATHYEPQTVPGTAAKTAVEAAGAILGSDPEALVSSAPKALAKKAVMQGVVPASAGQGAAAVAGKDNTDWVAPIAAFGTAIATHGASSVLGALADARTPESQFFHEFSKLTPEQQLHAQYLVRAAQQNNMRLSNPTAMQAASNGALPRLAEKQRYVERSEEGAPIMGQFYSDIAPTNQAAASRRAALVTPNDTMEPTEIGPRVQQAAVGPSQNAPRGTLEGEQQARTAAVRPFFTAAASEQVPPQHVEAALQNLDAEIAKDPTNTMPVLRALRDDLTISPAQEAIPGRQAAPDNQYTGPGAPEVPETPAVPRVPRTDIGPLDNVVKDYYRRMKLPDMDPDAIEKNTGRVIAGTLGPLRDAMESSSENYATGMSKFRDISNNVVDPFERSLTGRVAQLADDTKLKPVFNLMFGPDNTVGMSPQVGRLVRTVAGSDPSAAQQLVKMRIQSVANDRLNAPSGGPQMAKDLLGTPEDAARTEAAIRALPNGGIVWPALKRTLDVMDAQKYRLPVGSPTNIQGQIGEEMTRGPVSIEGAATAASPGKWPNFLSNLKDRYFLAKNTAEFARMATDPGKIADMRRLLAVGPKSSVAADIVDRILSSGPAIGKSVIATNQATQHRRGLVMDVP